MTDLLQAVQALGDPDAEERVRGLQTLINTGTWSLEGAVGRAMHHAIEDGLCALGPARARDYWGNTIPSRNDVVPGSKGSVEFVEEHSPFGGVLEEETT